MIRPDSLLGQLILGPQAQPVAEQVQAPDVPSTSVNDPTPQYAVPVPESRSSPSWAKKFFAEQDKKPFSAGARTLLKKAMEESDEASQLLQAFKSLGISDAVPRRKTNSKDRPRRRLSPEDQLLLELLGRQL